MLHYSTCLTTASIACPAKQIPAEALLGCKFPKATQCFNSEGNKEKGGNKIVTNDKVTDLELRSRQEEVENSEFVLLKFNSNW